MNHDDKGIDYIGLNRTTYGDLADEYQEHNDSIEIASEEEWQQYILGVINENVPQEYRDIPHASAFEFGPGTGDGQYCQARGS